MGMAMRVTMAVVMIVRMCMRHERPTGKRNENKELKQRRGLNLCYIIT